MIDDKYIEFISNESDTNHKKLIYQLALNATEIFIISAFGSLKGFESIQKPLIAQLKKRNKVSIILGLHNFQTEYKVVEKLASLAFKFENFNFYVSDFRKKNKMFHPKLYAFKSGRSTSVIIGSANFTNGGFQNNIEASVKFRMQNHTFLRYFSNLLAEWLNKGIILKISEIDNYLIAIYARQYFIHRKNNALAKQASDYDIETNELNDVKTNKVLESSGFELFEKSLEQLKNLHGNANFESQITKREQRLKKSYKILNLMSSDKIKTKKEFEEQYELLLDNWNSGGIFRGKNGIINNFRTFLESVKDIVAIKSLSPAQAFDNISEGLSSVTGAGPNTITEILHSIDPNKFPILNKNSANGVLHVFDISIPNRPTKSNINGQKYETFCNSMNKIQSRLKLKNYSELDILLNYIYWA